MPDVVTSTLLNFDTGTRDLISGVPSDLLSYDSGDDFTLNTGPRSFTLIDVDLGPLGAATVRVGFDLTFGVLVTASLGQLPQFSTGTDILVSAKYDNIVFQPDNNDETEDDIITVGTEQFVPFDFSDFTIINARSATPVGLGTGGTFVDPFGEDQDLPVGASISLIAGLTLGLEDVSYRLPLALRGTEVGDIPLLNQANLTVPLVTVDARDAISQSFELGDFFELSLTAPAGAPTEGSSVGSTFVTDKGFSDVSFVELTGDLDLMLTRLLGAIPGVGAVAKALENTVFFSEDIELADYISFLDEEQFSLGLTVVDIAGSAGLKITERVSVDYATDGDIDGVGFGGFGDTVDELGSLLGSEVEDPGAGGTPNVVVTLVTDNATPDDPTDDRVVQDRLGNPEVLVPLPTLDQDGVGSVATVGIDAFFDLGDVEVTHTIGLGGGFGVDISVLSGGIGGDLGDKLGISFGPLFETTVPEDGVNLSLIDILRTPVLLEGGTFDALPATGLLGDVDPNASRLEQLGYQAGDFGAAPSQARYEVVFASILPNGFDENAPDALARLQAFELAVNERIAVANQVMAEFLPDDVDVTEIRSGATLTALVDDNYFDDDASLSAQFGIWPAAFAGSTAEVELRVKDGDDENFVIAAPTVNANEVFEGLTFEIRRDAIREEQQGSDDNGSIARTVVLAAREIDADATNAELSDYFRISADAHSGGSAESYRYAIEGQSLISGTGEGLVGQSIPLNGDPPTNQAAVARANAQIAQDFVPLAINVVGTKFDDVVAYTGGTSGVQDPATTAPVYLDGAGSGTDNDLFLGDFESAHGDLAALWNIRAQQLAEDAAEGRTVTLANGLGGGNTIEVGDFEGNALRFLEADGEESHRTTVRDIERVVLRLGDGADSIRTGVGEFDRLDTDRSDYIEMGGGDDVLGISADAFEGRDRYALEAGDDLAVIFRTDVRTAEQGRADLGLTGRDGSEPGVRIAGEFDVLSGGIGLDEVLVTGDPDVADVTSGGIGYRIARDGDQFNPDAVGFKAPVTSLADFDAPEDALTFVAELSEVLGVNDADREARNGWTGITQTTVVPGDGTIDLVLGGKATNFVRLANDIEEISVSGADAVADMVFYLGGDVYVGGTAGEGVQPTDVFVADFGLWEDVKGATGVVLDGQAIAAEGSTGEEVFAGADVAGFEQFIVRGTDSADILIGAAEDDILDGGAGDDLLESGGGADGLVGGSGSDVITYDASEGGRSLIFADAFDVPLDGTVRDEDLLIVRAEGASGGLSYTFEVDGGRNLDLAADSAAETALEALTLGRSARLVDPDLEADPEAVATANAFEITIGDDADAGFFASGVERSNISGSDAHDDVLLSDGGATYIGGERAGDSDLFAADFSHQSIAVELLIQDDYNATESQSVRLENGVLISGVDRIVTRHGTGDDTVAGGRLDDHIDGGAGDDVLTGGNGTDVVIGGAGDDLIYWEGDDGQDTLQGGADRDRLLISNVRDDGAAFVQGGMGYVFGGEVARVGDGAGRLLGLAEDRDAETPAILSLGDAVTMEYTGFEAVDLSGSAEFDDLLIYQGGLLHVGGERAGDRDTFVADLSGETADLVLTTRDEAGGREVDANDIGNGVALAQVEQLIVSLGSGDDRVFGGVFADLIETGGGRDVVDASLGDDTIRLGGEDDAAEYIGGTQVIEGGEGIDRLSLGARGEGYSTLDAVVGGREISLDIADRAELGARRADLADLTGGTVTEITQGHAFGSVTHSGFEFVTASGDNSGDILIGGSEGAVLSSDGGDDILIGGAGDDLLLGGKGTDRYVLGRDFGFDVISGELEGRTEIHIIGRSLTEEGVSFSVAGGDRSDLRIAFSGGSQLTIRDYFAASIEPQTYVFFTDDAPEGRFLTLDEMGLSSVITAPSGLPAEGRTFFGTEASEIFADGTDGADIFFGFGGDDGFVSTGGPDLYDGANGRDLVSYEGSATGVVVDLTNGATGSRLFEGEDNGDIFVSIENIIGSNQGDFIVGSEDDNYLAGEAGSADPALNDVGGNDVLSGFGGNDLINGGPGSDRLDGGAGDDSLFGGTGNDFFAGGPVGTDIRFDDGSDTIEGGGVDFTLVDEQDNRGLRFGAGDDLMDGGAGDDTFDDRFGDNTIIGGAGDDTAFAGAGADLYVYVDGEEQGVPVEGTGGRDVFHAHDLGVGSDSVGSLESDDVDAVDTGGDQVDFSDYTAGVAILLDDGRADIAQADAGTIIGTAERAGGDTYAETVAAEAADNVRLMDFAGVEDVTGSRQDDVIRGSAANNVLDGEAGDDLLSGGAGDDLLIGGLGRDTVDYRQDGGTSGVTVALISRDANDLDAEIADGTATDAFGGTDRLRSVEVVIGTEFADEITGGDGREAYVWTGGNDTIDGGAGRIDLDLSQGVGAGDRFNLRLGEAAEGAFDRSAIRLDGGATELTLSTLNLGDIVTGDADAAISDQVGVDRITTFGDGVNFYESQTGSQTVIGGAGAQSLVSLGANDDVYVYGGGAADTVSGEGGIDALRLDGFADGVLATREAGTARALETGSEVTLEFSGFEILQGTDARDFLIGNDEVDILIGGASRDTLRGNGGGDSLVGGAGNDVVSGGAGDDTLIGGGRADTLAGGDDNDTFLLGDGVTQALVDGDDGLDVADFATLSTALRIADGVATTVVEGEAVTVATLTSIETVRGTGLDDVLDRREEAFDPPEEGEDLVFEGGAGDDVVFDRAFYSNRIAFRDQPAPEDFFFDGGTGFDIIDYSAQPLVRSFFDEGVGLEVDLEAGTVAEFHRLTSSVAHTLRFDNVEGVVGTAQGDRLLGTGQGNLFVGGGGEDRFDGRGGNDTVDFGREGGEGGITVTLSTNTALFSAGRARDSAGNQEFLVSIESAIGTAEDDRMTGAENANLLDGAAGNDSLSGEAGDDTLIAGAGTDTLRGGAGDDLLIFGTDLVGADIDPAAAPTLSGVELLDGGDNTDLVDLSNAAGGLTIALDDAGTGDVTVDLGADAGGGTGQTLARLIAVEGVVGSAFGDSLTGNAGNNLIAAGDGNDTVLGGAGLDTLDGGAGLDLLAFGAGGGVTVNLTTGEVVNSGGGVEQIANFEGVLGGAGDDALFGDAGANVFNGGLGNDTIRGGTGIDLLDLSRSDAAQGQTGTGATVLLDARNGTEGGLADEEASLAGGLVRDTFGDIDTVSDIENVLGSRFDDLIVGDGGDNFLIGADGADTLDGGGGRDLLTGGAGEDVFRVQVGGGFVTISDFVFGEDRVDVTDFELLDVQRAVRDRDQDPLTTGGDTVLTLRDGTSIRLVGVDSETFDGRTLIIPASAPREINALDGGGLLEGDFRSESFQGFAAPDLILAGDGDDILDGGLGDDTLDGGEGDDTAVFDAASAGVSIDLELGEVRGGAGSDTILNIERIIGSAFGDTLTGSDRAETLDGGGGADTILPGGGADVIVTGGGRDQVGGSLGDLDGDVITDFGAVDRLVIRDVVLTSDQVTPDPEREELVIDVNGDGIADARIGLPGSVGDAIFRLDTLDGDTTITSGGAEPTDALLTDGRERYVSATAQVIDAGGGDDTITASADGAVILGGAGNDVLTSEGETSIVVGGQGSDTVVLRGREDQAVIRASDASVEAPAADVITGFEARDVLHLTGFGFSSRADIATRSTDAGLELTLGANQTVLLEAVTDFDNVRVSFADVSVPSLVTAANRVILPSEAGGSITYVTDRAGDQTLRGSGQADVLGGGPGADTLIGGPGSDTASYETGTEGVDISLSAGRVAGGDAEGDVLNSIENLIGGAGNDILEGTSGAEVLSGAAGDDTLRGLGGLDTINGGTGDDRIETAGGVFVARGDAGNDVFVATGANGALDGGLGDDLFNVRGASGIVVSGGAGSDRYLITGTGALDIVEDRRDAGVDEVVATGSADIGPDHIESLTLVGSLNTFARGNGLDNVITGNRGDNVLDGRGGSDRLLGAGGDDTLTGGAGADTLLGGSGSDTYVVGTGDVVIESRRFEGTDTVLSSVDFRMGRQHIENLELTGEAQLGAGNGLRNVITGNDGDNTLDGGKNVDTLIGGDGDDRYLLRAPGDNAVETTDGGIDTVLAFRALLLDDHVENLFLQTLRNDAGEGVAGVNGIGNDLDNQIVGNPFDNVINGREGADTLRGQAGNDVFVFDRAPDTGIDTIVDFETNAAGEDDLLRFAQSAFTGIRRGAIEEELFRLGDTALDANDRFLFDGNTLFFDVDGAGGTAAEAVALFQRGATLTFEDIEIV